MPMKITGLKTYALATGIVLFCLGIFGFAFKQNLNIGDGYLLISLILGFWGIIAAIYNN